MQRVIDRGQFALPSFAPGGAFPHARGRFAGPPAETGEELAAIATLYVAAMTTTGLSLIESGNDIIVDGGLANNAALLGVLAALRPSQNVVRTSVAEGTALDAANFYAETFPDTAVGAVHRAPGDYPAGKQGDVLTVEFTVMGIPCLGLNGGDAFKHSEAFSFQVATDDQAETDRLWNAIVGNGGLESACGWCKDKWGLSWQITPRALTAAITDPDPAAAKRAFEAMMDMTKIDIAAIEAARRG